MIRKHLRSCGFVILTAFCASFSVGNLHAASARDTQVPNNFVNIYVGFNQNQNVTVSQSVDASFYNLKKNNQVTFDFNNLKQENSIWGGISAGHWFTQAPASLGLSLSMDIFPSKITKQTVDDGIIMIDNAIVYKGPIDKNTTKLLQMPIGFNLLFGVPLKFLRVYAGGGPALFVSFYTFTLYEGTKDQFDVYANGANLGFNALLGVDFFISKHISAFVEGKYSQVDNLKFEPDLSNVEPPLPGTFTDTYQSLKTQRVAIGLSFHF